MLLYILLLANHLQFLMDSMLLIPIIASMEDAIVTIGSIRRYTRYEHCILCLPCLAGYVLLGMASKTRMLELSTLRTS